MQLLRCLVMLFYLYWGITFLHFCISEGCFLPLYLSSFSSTSNASLRLDHLQFCWIRCTCRCDLPSCRFMHTILELCWTFCLGEWFHFCFIYVCHSAFLFFMECLNSAFTALHTNRLVVAAGDLVICLLEFSIYFSIYK